MLQSLSVVHTFIVRRNNRQNSWFTLTLEDSWIAGLLIHSKIYKTLTHSHQKHNLPCYKFLVLEFLDFYCQQPIYHFFCQCTRGRKINICYFFIGYFFATRRKHRVGFFLSDCFIITDFRNCFYLKQ